MRKIVFQAAVRRLTKHAGGKLSDALRGKVSELLADYNENAAKGLLAKVAEFAQHDDLDGVLKAVTNRIERRGAEADEFRAEALRRATEGERSDDGQQSDDGDVE